MLVLLPPSAGKAEPRRGAPLAPDRLSFAHDLAGPRRTVAEALVRLSNGPAETARRVLALSVRQDSELAANAAIPTSPTLPALRLYSGVLYDAMLTPPLAPAAVTWLRRHVVVLSGLFGAVTPGDRLPHYRLPMGTDLPGVGPLASFWRPHLHAALAARARGLVVDLRSADYVAAWRPPAERADHWVQVHVRRGGAVVSHDAKHTRGLVARHLALLGAPARSAHDLRDVLSPAFRGSLTRRGAGWRLELDLD